MALKTPEPELAFAKFIKRSGELRSRPGQGSELDIAKAAIKKAIDDQKGYLSLRERNLTPQAKKEGGKAPSEWFWLVGGEYATSIRYGQVTVPILGQPDHVIGTAKELHGFYDAVKAEIDSGALNTVISKLQTERSENLKRALPSGKLGRRPRRKRLRRPPPNRSAKQPEVQPELVAAEMSLAGA